VAAGVIMRTRPPLEVAHVIHRHGPDLLAEWGPVLSAAQRRALKELAQCRTAALGGHVEECDHCRQRLIAYNSCRNRHCPKCQGERAAAWLEREATSLLPIEYHHVVFTLPHELGPLALQHPAVVYNLLLQTAAQALRQVTAERRWLGAEVGVVAVLHTWGQTLQHHPHVHCVVSGGGLAVDDRGCRREPPCWRSCPAGFLVPVRVLSAVFRARFLAGLQQAHAAGRLACYGPLAALAEASRFASWLEPLRSKAWVVYSKPPFAGPATVLQYLARYTHRVAFSNGRLRRLEQGAVTFTYRDYAHGGRERLQTLTAVEFLRRFLQHVLPRGFVKVRHYGLLANGAREAKLALCRWLLAVAVVAAAVACAAVFDDDVRCPVCGVGRLIRVGELTPSRGLARADTS
jgi:hypothetical protein